MPNDWDDEDDNDGQSESELVKSLRKQLKAKNARETELETELSTLRPQVRKSTVSSVLSEIGVNPKIAALLPDSVAPTKEAVNEWLKDYGDLFNITVPDSNTQVVDGEPRALPGQKTQVVDQTVQDQWTRMQSGEAAAGTSIPDIEKQQLSQLGDAVAKSNGNSDVFFKLLRETRG